MLDQQERAKVSSRFDTLYTNASTWRSRCKDIQTYLMPMRGCFEDADPYKAATPDFQAIINSSPSLALRTLAAWLSSGMTSASLPWFRYEIPDPDLNKFRPVRMWLQNLEDRSYAVLAKSNTHQCFDIVYEEVPGFGVGAMIVDEDFTNAIRGHAFTAGEYVVGLDAKGKVNTFGRKITMSVSQMAEEYGLEALSAPAKQAYAGGKYDQLFQIHHMIEPNLIRKMGMKNSANMAYRSVYWERGRIQESTLRESGYNSFPVMVPRWKTRDSAAIYGNSPAWEALGDIKMLQKMESKSLLIVDKLADPPMLYDDAMDGEPTFLPGEAIPYSGANPNPVQSAYNVKPDLPALEAKIARVEERIGRDFFLDVMMIVSRLQTHAKTAYEVSKLFEEKMMVFGPVLESFKDELHDPFHDRLIEVMINAGMIPLPPPELEGMEIKIDYTSSLAQAQKTIGTSTIIEFYGFHERVCALYPEARDTVDPDKLLKAVHGKQGIPVEIMRDEAEVQAIREGRQQAEEQAAQEQQVAQRVATSKTLGDTKVAPDNALGMILKGAGGAPAQAAGVV